MHIKSRLAILTIGIISLGGIWVFAQDRPRGGPPRGNRAQGEDRSESVENEKRGLICNKAGAFAGYTLFAPQASTETYLVDMEGRVVHTWKCNCRPGCSVYLLEDGTLLRAGTMDHQTSFHGGGIGGRVQKYNWNGELVWDYQYSDRNHCQHHDIEPLPNGNVLLVAWERKSEEDVIAAGRNPEQLMAGELWPDHVVEVKPTGPKDGDIVWQWHLWDHLIQDFDESKANYGNVAEHPELVDLNYVGQSMKISRDEMQRLRSLGYVGGMEEPNQPEEEEQPRRGPGGFGGMGGPGGGGQADWNHTNGIDYNEKLDQIALSVLGFSEVWVIDHSTTTTEAASHAGGRSGKGGDLLYRWGNPQAYRAGFSTDQRYFAQHDAQWIEPGCPGAGNILAFNNGRNRPDGDYSSIDEVAPVVDAKGRYKAAAGGAFAPSDAKWSYVSEPRSSFFAGHISGAQRLPNGNTFICSGERGRFFEVTSEGEIVWEYRNPIESQMHGPPGGLFGRMLGSFGGPRRPGPPEDGEDIQRPRPGRRPGQRPERRDQSGDQQDRARERRERPSDRQNGHDDQPNREDDRRGRRRGFGPPGGRPPGPGGFGGPGGGPGGGEVYAAFRATRIPLGYPGLKGRDLTPKPVTEAEKKPEPAPEPPTE